MLVLLQEILPTSQISLSGQNDHYNSHDDDDDHDDYDDDDDDDDDVGLPAQKTGPAASRGKPSGIATMKR